MNTEIAKGNDLFKSAIAELNDLKQLEALLFNNPHYKKIAPEGITAIVLAARALDMDIFRALNGALYYVNGKVGMAAEEMSSRVRAAGHSITKEPNSNDDMCILTGKRWDTGDEITVSFSIDDAKRAAIYNDRSEKFQKSGWYKYPGVMCYNRAMSKLYRQLFADLSLGYGYTKDELIEISENKKAENNKKTFSLYEVAESASAANETTSYECITDDELNELDSLLSYCTSEYKERVKSYFSKLNPPIENISQLPRHLFKRVKDAAIKNRKESEAIEDIEDSEELSVEIKPTVFEERQYA